MREFIVKFRGRLIGNTEPYSWHQVTLPETFSLSPNTYEALKRELQKRWDLPSNDDIRWHTNMVKTWDETEVSFSARENNAIGTKGDYVRTIRVPSKMAYHEAVQFIRDELSKTYEHILIKSMKVHGVLDTTGPVPAEPKFLRCDEALNIQLGQVVLHKDGHDNYVFLGWTSNTAGLVPFFQSEYKPGKHDPYTYSTPGLVANVKQFPELFMHVKKEFRDQLRAELPEDHKYKYLGYLGPRQEPEDNDSAHL